MEEVMVPDMIKTKADLKRYLAIEKSIYKLNRTEKLTCDIKRKIWRYVQILRYSEYYYNNRNRTVSKLLYVWYRRKRNILGNKLGFEIWENNFCEGLTIHHAGYIVINREVRAGKNIQLHGCNCIGNNGKSISSPRLGNDIDIGFGAGLFGAIEIASNIKIGAGAIVVKSCKREHTTLTGVPAVDANGSGGHNQNE